MGTNDATDHHGDEHELKFDADTDTEEDHTSTRTLAALKTTKVENLEPLLSKLKGQLERGNTNATEHPSGVPRGWSRPRTLASMEDSETVDTFLWTSDPTPLLPRTHKRMKQGAAGRVAIIRDTSMSMQGMWNNWASLLCTSVMEMSRKQKMRVGYLEFNTRAQKFVDPKKKLFFTKEYDSLEQRMSIVKCEGLTNYEAPLAIALDEFDVVRRRRGGGRRGSAFIEKRATQSASSRWGSDVDFGGKSSGGSLGSLDDRSNSIADSVIGGSSRLLDCNSPVRGRATDQHILFITDGQPTSGDRSVTKELERARVMGVSIHTVFIGYRACPAVLDMLSKQTNGSRFAAFFCPHEKSIQVVDRESSTFDQHGKDMELRMVDRMTRMPTVFQRYLDENNLTL